MIDTHDPLDATHIHLQGALQQLTRALETADPEHAATLARIAGHLSTAAQELSHLTHQLKHPSRRSAPG